MTDPALRAAAILRRLDLADHYPFEPCFAATPGGTMHYVDEGQGAPLLLLHGNPTWSFLWRHQIAGLRAEYRVIAPDHIGFGLSDKPTDEAA